MTHLEHAIRSQPVELERLAARDFAPLAARPEDRMRAWLVGTGSSQHVAELGALLFAETGLDARWCGSSEFGHHAVELRPDDAVVVVSHTARTSFAIAAREASLRSGAEVLSIGADPDRVRAATRVDRSSVRSYQLDDRGTRERRPVADAEAVVDGCGDRDVG